MTDLDVLSKAIETGILLGPETFVDIDPEAFMDAIVDTQFERTWVEAWREVFDLGIEPEDKSRIDALGISAFVKTCQRIGKSGKLSESISDDFFLIGKACLLLPHNKTAAAMLDSYLAQTIPHEPLAFSRRMLPWIVEEIRRECEERDA